MPARPTKGLVLAIKVLYVLMHRRYYMQDTRWEIAAEALDEWLQHNVAAAATK